MALSIKEILKKNKGPLYKEASRLGLEVKQSDKKHIIQAALWPRHKDATAFLKLTKSELVDKLPDVDQSKKKWQIQYAYLKGKGSHEAEEGALEEKMKGSLGKALDDISNLDDPRDPETEWKEKYEDDWVSRYEPFDNPVIGRENYPDDFKREFLKACKKALKHDTPYAVFRNLESGEYLSVRSGRGQNSMYDRSRKYQFMVNVWINA